MKIRILIGNFLYKLGFKPSIEVYANNNEIICGGFFRFKDKIGYHDGVKAYLFPVTKLPSFYQK